MKKINRYLSTLLVLSMMLCSTFLLTVSTAETENEEIAVGVTGNLGGENELQPMAAQECGYQYENLTSMFDDLGLSYTGTGHPYSLGNGYTYSMAPGGSHDYQNVILYKNGKYVGMYTCLNG